jgi:hypothetical protein
MASRKDGGYVRLARVGRRRRAHVTREIVCTLRGFLPLSRQSFERRLAGALGEAERQGQGFYLGGFAARRALRDRLVIDIDPARLEQKLQIEFLEDGELQLVRDKFLGAGAWAPLLIPIRGSSTYREVAEIISGGFDYGATNAFRKALERARSDRPVRRNFVTLSSPELVEAYYRQTAETCRSVSERGVLRRSEYGTHFTASAPWMRLPWIELGELDVGVAIGAAGELFRFASGKHRTAAAQALGLKSMPVEARMVHAQWLREQMAKTGLPLLDALLHGIATLDISRAASPVASE